MSRDRICADVDLDLEAAEEFLHSQGGPDEADNGLALCALHHVLFDLWALGLNADLIAEERGWGAAYQHPPGSAFTSRPRIGMPSITA